MIKITFKSQESTARCLRDGLRMFNLFISPKDIEEEEFFDVLMCYRCFALDNHATNLCPKDNNYVICSLCSDLGHNYKSCPSNNKRQCINCSGEHSTLSFSCKARKTIVANLRNRKPKVDYESYHSLF